MYVVFVCPKEEVIWVYTGRIIALMEDTKTFRDLTMREEPGHAVGIFLGPINLKATIPIIAALITLP